MPDIPGRILVVEDQTYDRDLLVRVLRSDGHDVHTCHGGADALVKLEELDPHVVLCDVIMPNMNGLDFCRAVRTRPRYIPVLLVTGKVGHEDLLAGFEAGADDYVTKPIEARELRARVRTMVRMRQLQGQLEQQTEKLREANQDMEEFLHAVSHDLRTPVISLLGMVAMLQRRLAGLLDDECAELFMKVRQSAEAVSQLVNHLVEFARMGTAPHRPRATALDSLVHQACTNLTSQILQAGASLDIQQDWPTLVCDPVSICQVFQNLIGNALKFAKPGSRPEIRVRARCQRGAWHIQVQDNGVGIPPEKHQEIFRLFARLGQVETSGLGVGLSTVEKIVKRHGGRIWVESQAGQGSVFHFTIPEGDRTA